MSDQHPPEDVGDASYSNTEGRVRERSTSGVRVAPLLMGVTFAVIAVIALAMNPDGFDERAILLWPVVIVLLIGGGFVALISHIATRRSS